MKMRTYVVQKQAVVDKTVIVASQVVLQGRSKEAILVEHGANNPRHRTRFCGIDLYTDDNGWTYLVTAKAQTLQGDDL